jgi:Tfp pilus assembly protein PilN
MFAVVMLGAVSAFLVMKRAAMSVQASFERVSSEYEQEAQKIEQLRDLEAQRATMIDQAAVASALLDPVPRSVLLGELARDRPVDMVITRFDLDSKRVQAAAPAAAAPARTAVRFGQAAAPAEPERKIVAPPRFESTIAIEGIAKVNNDIADYLATLKQSILLEDVELEFIREAVVGQERLRRFKMTARLRADADASQVAGVQPFEGSSFAVVEEEGG